jgi:hypothetical protein
MWDGEAVVYFKILSRYLPKQTKGNLRLTPEWDLIYIMLLRYYNMEQLMSAKAIRFLSLHAHTGLSSLTYRQSAVKKALMDRSCQWGTGMKLNVRAMSKEGNVLGGTMVLHQIVIW